MSIVLDTSILVDHLRGSEDASEYLAGLDARPSCSEISRIEVIQGLRSSERRGADRLFALIAWVPVSESVSRRAGELGRRWRRSHPGIGVADLAIAATAEALDIGLATRNIKHFPMFEDLRAPY
ncbi:MAG TPA: type II toxin-antitoxin system VapC family toxin [Solirubrobacterales bacterium]|nr:type II toxin-antitoxin system VapC family toxin [Solirubrobacterales bacterium]